MNFITELETEQWIVDKLIEHEGHNIDIELLDGEVLLSCLDCQEIVINFFKEGCLSE